MNFPNSGAHVRAHRYAPVPIPGQPGLVRMQSLAGLGDLRSDLNTAQASYDDVKARATRLLAAYGPLSADILTRLGAAVKEVGMPIPVIITVGQFAAVIRMGLAAAAGNIARARAIVQSGLPGHDALATGLITAAKGVLRELDTMINGANVAEGVLASGARRIGLRGLGVFAIDDVTAIGIAAVVGVVLLAGVIIAVYAATRASARASEAADTACHHDADAGHPCTGDQWVTYRDRAASQERDLSPIPDLDPLFQQGGSLLFWGGLLAVGGVLAYGAWVAAPAGAVARSRLRSRAEAF